MLQKLEALYFVAGALQRCDALPAVAGDAKHEKQALNDLYNWVTDIILPSPDIFVPVHYDEGKDPHVFNTMTSIDNEN